MFIALSLLDCAGKFFVQAFIVERLSWTELSHGCVDLAQCSQQSPGLMLEELGVKCLCCKDSAVEQSARSDQWHLNSCKCFQILSFEEALSWQVMSQCKSLPLAALIMESQNVKGLEWNLKTIYSQPPNLSHFQKACSKINSAFVP